MRFVLSLCSVVVFGVLFAVPEVDSDVVGSIIDTIDKVIVGADDSIAGFISELKKRLLQYIAGQFTFDVDFYLYTPSNPKERYNLQSNQRSLKDSPFDSNLETKFLVHGYSVHLKPESAFFDIKDEILYEGNYNVIVVNWTKHNQGDYVNASINTVIVGMDIAKLIQLQIENTGISSESVHIIGHSLGAQAAGFAGKNLENLGRISGVDAAGPLFQTLPTTLRLWYTDANFVDAMHTNGALLVAKGLGTFNPYGDLDFFPNGGSVQPGCKYGDTFLDTEKTTTHANTLGKQLSCSHDRALYLFLYSIRTCPFLSVYCRSYARFNFHMCQRNAGSSSNGYTVERMGFHAEPNPTLPPMSRFYLKTNANPPYCE